MIMKAADKNQEMEDHASNTQTIISYSLLLLGVTVISMAVASIVYLGWL